MGTAYCNYNNTTNAGVTTEGECVNSIETYKQFNTEEAPATRMRTTSFISTARNTMATNDYASRNKVNHERPAPFIFAAHGTHHINILPPLNLGSSSREHPINNESVLSVSQKIEFDAFNNESDSKLKLTNIYRMRKLFSNTRLTRIAPWIKADQT